LNIEKLHDNKTRITATIDKELNH